MKSNKRVNVKLLIAIVVMTLVIMGSGMVNAKTYDISEQKVSISLDDEFIDIFTEYTENQEKLSGLLPSDYYDTFIKTNERQGVVFDAVKLDENNEMLTEVLISIVDTNSKEIRDFKDFNESEMKKNAKAFVSSLESEMKSQLASAQVNEDEIYTADNGDVYIKLHTNLAGQESDAFYTVKNYNLIGINVRYLDGNRDFEMAKRVINQVRIEDTTSSDKKTGSNTSIKNNSLSNQSDSTTNSYYYSQVISSTVFFVIVLSTVISSRKSSKNEVITEEQQGKFKNFGGFLIFYVVALAINIALQAMVAIGLLEDIGSLSYLMSMAQAIITIICVISILVFIFMRKTKTPKIIRTILYIMLAVNVIMGLAQIGYSFIDEDNIYYDQFYFAKASEIIANISYTLIWTTYFSISKRVKVYYGLENSTEEVEVAKNEIVENRSEVVEQKNEVVESKTEQVEKIEDNIEQKDETNKEE